MYFQTTTDFHLVYTPVFPEELWKLILDKLTDSDDIQHLMNSIPNLSHGLKKTKIYIYFANTIPILFKNSFFYGKDIMNCRLVCKFWRAQIDNFLETTEPAPQIYNKFSSLTQSDIKLDLENGVANRPAICLQTATEIRKLTKAICKHPGNPFVGRSVNFIMNTVEVADDNSEDIELEDELAAYNFIRAMHSFIRKFGHHIRFATLDFALLTEGEDSSRARRNYSRIIQCLGYLPNVHSIKIDFNIPDESPVLAWFDGFVADELQPGKLKSLKSFEFLSNFKMPNSSFRSFLKCIMQQGNVTSVGLPMSLWRSEYKHLLSNVENLSVDAEWSPSYQNLKSMFTNTNFQSLKKLRLVPCGAKNKFLNMSNLLKQLQTVNLKTLDISNYSPLVKVSMPRITENPSCIVSSIEFVSIYDSLGVSYDFLYLFPSIKNLTIHANNWLEISYSEDCFQPPATLTEVIRRYMYTNVVNENVSIWDMLPSQQNLTILCSGVRLKKFSREYKNKYFQIEM